MMTQMQRMDVVTNNIANADTTGYKKDKVAAQSFTEALMHRINDPALLRMFKNSPIGGLNQGVFIDEVYTDFTGGSLRQTNGPLDVAIGGQGFFVVEVNGETLYTRDGSFVLRSDGALIKKDGGLVQGENGNIMLPNGAITIDENGRIFVGDDFIDQLRITDFADKTILRKLQDNYYRTIENTGTIPFEGSLSQGFLENSNVNSVKEMVEMIALSRSYETNSRMITIHDTTLGRAVNDIARR
jgi:flagellar basal-body rod protein FlgG